MESIRVQSPRQFEGFCEVPGGVTLSPGLPSVQQADEHWLVRDSDHNPLARCSIWWRLTPAHPDHTLGLIGHYAAQDDVGAAALLDTVCDRLRTQGCSLAVGPMDGNTFRHYRLLTERAVDDIERPPFFLEPDNPDSWPLQFIAAGFEPFANYVTSYGELPAVDPRMDELLRRGADAGVTVRSVDMARFEEELGHIFEIVTDSFRNNLLYLPIERQEFLAQYALIRPVIRPELVLIAELDGSPVGFIFALPDMSQRQRGEPVDTLIVKTVGVLPSVRGHGVASLLAAHVQTAARAIGLRYVIHALMHETNVSRQISAHYASPIRRYTLFAKELSDFASISPPEHVASN